MPQGERRREELQHFGELHSLPKDRGAGAVVVHNKKQRQSLRAAGPRDEPYVRLAREDRARRKALPPTSIVTGVIATSWTLDSRASMSRDQTSTPSVIANAATRAATPMITPVVERTVRRGLARSASVPTRADSINAAKFGRDVARTSLLRRGSRESFSPGISRAQRRT